MRKYLARLIGGIFVFFGIIGLFTPIPLGLVFILIGLLFLIPTTPSVLTATRKARKRSDMFDRAMETATHKAPYPYRKIFRSTRHSDW